jgi:hypothetical protein
MDMLTGMAVFAQVVARFGPGCDWDHSPPLTTDR